MNHDRFTEEERRAIDLFCDGDESFFLTYREACREQFRSDFQQADLQLAGSDLLAFRRTAHSLKSVLKSLGQPDLADQAAQLERLVIDQPTSHWLPVWEQLRSGIAHAYVLDSDGT